MRKNVILISVDTLRPDRLSCNGYKGIKTPNIDEIAKAGATYTNCMTASCLTPVSMASILTAKYPIDQGLRNPFGKIQATTVTELFKNKGYVTGGFTGINFLSQRCNFDKGFDTWDEPTEETRWFQKKYEAPDNTNGEKMTTQWGNWWPPKMMEFIEKNKHIPFFTWGHYFEVHFHAEKWMLKNGMLENGVLSENAYYDAKIKYFDEHVIGPLNKYLKDNGLWEKTMIVLMSDHGETMMQNPNLPLEEMSEDYPKHRTMSRDDLLSTLIMTHVRKPGTTVDRLVRSIDVVPTILDVCFGERIWNADGQSLAGDFPHKDAYSEEMFEARGAGALQAINDGRFKLVRNNTTGKEEFYNIENPTQILSDETLSLYDSKIKQMRHTLDSHLDDIPKNKLKPEDEQIVLDKMKELGYI